VTKHQRIWKCCLLQFHGVKVAIKCVKFYFRVTSGCLENGKKAVVADQQNFQQNFFVQQLRSFQLISFHSVRKYDNLQLHGHYLQMVAFRSLIITSAKEVMFLPDFVCLCVSKITQKVMDGSF